MNLQLLSDLHLETEDFEPVPAPDADVLVLAGDIDSGWDGYARFAGWPVPVLVVAGNHEFDGRELDTALPAFAAHCERFGLQVLERRSVLVRGRDGRAVRFVGTTRWCDFDVYGPSQRERCLRAGTYFQKVMQATRGGLSFDAAAVRDEALACRAWLEQELSRPAAGWQRTVVITHFAPSLRSADPRYGRQPSTAAFCNADDDLLQHADLWLHGHVHCRHDYRVDRPGRRPARVVCQSRGLASRGEDEGFDGLRLLSVA